jgi:hypothetical protein
LMVSCAMAGTARAAVSAVAASSRGKCRVSMNNPPCLERAGR